MASEGCTRLKAWIEAQNVEGGNPNITLAWSTKSANISPHMLAEQLDSATRTACVHEVRWNLKPTHNWSDTTISRNQGAQISNERRVTSMSQMVFDCKTNRHCKTNGLRLEWGAQGCHEGLPLWLSIDTIRKLRLEKFPGALAHA